MTIPKYRSSSVSAQWRAPERVVIYVTSRSYGAQFIRPYDRGDLVGLQVLG